jgi:hypothetical protein
MDWVDDELADRGIGDADITYVHTTYNKWLHARAAGHDDDDDDDEDREHEGKRPSEAILDSIFAKLDLDDDEVVTKAGTPRYDVVKSELRRRGYAAASADAIADAFGEWQHDDDGKKLKRATRSELYEVFGRLDLDDHDVVTTRGIPRVDVVRKELDKDGYAAVDSDDISEAFEDWKKH